MKKFIFGATGLALTAAVISGTNNFFTKIAVTGVSNPILYTTLKNSLVGVLFLGVIFGLKKWREFASLSKGQIIKLTAIGIIGGSIPFALYFTGLTMTSALNASLIHKTLFLWVFLFAVPFLKERMTKLQLLGVLSIFAANVFIGGFGGFKFNSGEFMILLATILWAVENIVAKKVLKDLSSIAVASSRMVLGSLILILFLEVKGTAFPPELSAAAWGWTALTSVLLFGYVLAWYSALKRAPATYVATLLVPATLVTNVLSAVFVTHSLALPTVMTSLLYALGIVLVVFTARPGQKLAAG
ncbi:MAG: DMT family transporter [Candidatus Liptonbacteria bacterium]|nr:DMT family transporter [Candidatus Liptonbacteria bacterium]